MLQEELDEYKVCLTGYKTLGTGNQEKYILGATTKKRKIPSQAQFGKIHLAYTLAMVPIGIHTVLFYHTT